MPSIILSLSLNLAFADESNDFIKKHEASELPPITQVDGKREWDKLLELFKKSGDPGLLKLVLQSKPKSQMQAVQRAIVIYDLFMARTPEFIAAAKKHDQGYGCVLEALIPRTQFIPYEDIKTKLDSIKPATGQIKEFKEYAQTHYKTIKRGGSIDPKRRCK